MKLNQLSITDAQAGLAQKEFSARELVESCLAAIDVYDQSINSFLTVNADGARTDADLVDERRANGDVLPPLAGIPIAIKDVIATKGIRTTAASKILEDFTPTYDATAVAKLKTAGAIVLGKTNCDEFAHGASNEYSAFGVVRNPWDLTRVPGGSSGGSAAAVAADMCIAALGTDTGGSVRQPAAFCGRVGLKPTYGRVSRYGLLSMASSTDVVGTLTKTVRDSATLLLSLAGQDARDATTADTSVPDFATFLGEDCAGLTLGIPEEYLADTLDPTIRRAFDDVVKTLERLGAKIESISLPHTRHGVAAYYVITPAEISSNLARYDGVRYGLRADETDRDLIGVYAATRAKGFGPEVTRRIMLGTYALSAGYYDAYYHKASQVRTLIGNDFASAFSTVDAIVTPTTPTPAFTLGEKSDDPLSLYLEDIFVVNASVAGLPAISVPSGIAQADGVALPIGAQVIGKHFDEGTILRIAHAFEYATTWHTMRPTLAM